MIGRTLSHRLSHQMWWGPFGLVSLLSRLTDTLIKKLTHGLGLQVHLLQCLKGHRFKGTRSLKVPSMGLKGKLGQKNR